MTFRVILPVRARRRPGALEQSWEATKIFAVPDVGYPVTLRFSIAGQKFAASLADLAWDADAAEFVLRMPEKQVIVDPHYDDYTFWEALRASENGWTLQTT